MKGEKIFDGITHIKDETVAEAAAHKFRRPRYSLFSAVAALLAVTICIGVLMPGGTTVYAISEAKYPTSALLSSVPGYTGGFTAFLTASTQAFLTDTEEQNPVYSPLSAYLALGMTAEITDGDSRRQILNALREEKLTDVRKLANALWEDNYCDDGQSTTILGSSLWLSDSIGYNKDTLDTLSDSYYASSYRGEMGDPEYTRAYQNWLSQQTGGLLEDAVSQRTLDEETVLSLVTTVLYQGRWDFPFSEKLTAPDTFHTPDGDVTADFMHKKGADNYYWADQFGAMCIYMRGGATMWFLLPDEGVTPEELMGDPQVMEFLLAGRDWENQKQVELNLAVPKFDVSSELDLKAGLQKLGVTDIFEQETADFSAMTKDPGEVYLNRISHAARVAIDEEGVVAAALTDEEWCGAMQPPDDKVDFILDRPFAFAITNSDNIPLFLGIVNEP